MLRAYKYRIYPTDDQKVLLAKTFGCCRFVYNWALNLKKAAYEERKETRGEVKPVDCPLVDDRPCVLKSNDRKKQEKRGGKCASEAAKSLV